MGSGLGDCHKLTRVQWSLDLSGLVGVRRTTRGRGRKLASQVVPQPTTRAAWVFHSSR